MLKNKSGLGEFYKVLIKRESAIQKVVGSRTSQNKLAPQLSRDNDQHLRKRHLKPPRLAHDCSETQNRTDTLLDCQRAGWVESDEGVIFFTEDRRFVLKLPIIRIPAKRPKNWKHHST